MAAITRAGALIEEVAQDGWVELTLARPERRNALSCALVDELTDALARAEGTHKAAVLTARGPVFCAGADLAEGMSLDPGRPSARLVRALTTTSLLVVAAVDGGVYGAGISLLSACPIVVATDRATVGLPEAKRGIFPLGVVPYLEGVVPRRRLLTLGLEGGAIAASEAYRLGLFTELVDQEDLKARARHWASLAIERPAVATQAAQWWREPLADPSFHSRVSALEALLGDTLPAPGGAGPR